MGKLTTIFSELVRMLKDLPPGGFEKLYAPRQSCLLNANPVSFMCDKQKFRDAMRVADLGARLSSQAHNLGEVAPVPFVAAVLLGM